LLALALAAGLAYLLWRYGAPASRPRDRREPVGEGR
jgi:hypothetical protein